MTTVKNQLIEMLGGITPNEFAALRQQLQQMESRHQTDLGNMTAVMSLQSPGYLTQAYRMVNAKVHVAVDSAEKAEALIRQLQEFADGKRAEAAQYLSLQQTVARLQGFAPDLLEVEVPEEVSRALAAQHDPTYQPGFHPEVGNGLEE